MKHKINKIYPFIFSLSILFILIFISFYIVCFYDKNMLIKLWDKFDTIKELPFTLSREDLIKLQNELMSYLSGKLKFLETKVTIDNQLMDFYSIRTKIHMGDVKVIFKNFAYIFYFSIAIALFSLFKIKKLEHPFKAIYDAYVKTVVVFCILFGIIFFYAALNFDNFFIRFHQALFTNDYWLLDPKNDYIICLLPETIFMNIGLAITILSLLFIGLFGFLCRILSKIQLPLEAK